MDGIPKNFIAASIPFRFLVGPDAKEYTIHSSLVALQSPRLQEMVDSSLEAASYDVTWDDIDEQSFVSFWEFAYTGDYELSDSACTSDGCTNPDTDSGSSKNDEKTCRDHVIGIEYPPKLKDKDFSAALLHHARVCVLADRYGITRLMNLAIHKLGTAVKNYTTIEDRVQGIMSLLKLCYAALVPERLKRLATHYASDDDTFDHLWKLQGFQELLDEHAALSKAMLELYRRSPPAESGHNMKTGNRKSDGNDEGKGYIRLHQSNQRKATHKVLQRGQIRIICGKRVRNKLKKGIVTRSGTSDLSTTMRIMR